MQQLQSFGVLDRPLRQHYVLVPLFQTGLVLVVLRLVLLYELLQEYFEVGLVLGQGEAQGPQEAVCVGLDFPDWLVLEFAADAE